MKKMRFSILAAAAALLVGVAIGHYAIPGSKIPRVKTAATALSSEANTSVATTILPPPKDSTSTIKSTGEPAPSSAEQIIESIKAAVARPDTRHTYVTFSKLAESVDEKNVREVLAFAQNLPRQQDKSTLVSLLVGRWAEFDPKSAIAYAQSLPGGSPRNAAVTSVVGGWAEHDLAAATAWTQQLPPGQARDQAMQTIVSSLADKDPQAALSFLENLPPGRSRQHLYWPIFSRWATSDPMAAAEAATQLPAGTSRDATLQAIGSTWANQDPEAAFTWANNLPQNQGRTGRRKIRKKRQPSR